MYSTVVKLVRHVLIMRVKRSLSLCLSFSHSLTHTKINKRIKLINYTVLLKLKTLCGSILMFLCGRFFLTQGNMKTVSGLLSFFSRYEAL